MADDWQVVDSALRGLLARSGGIAALARLRERMKAEAAEARELADEVARLREREAQLEQEKQDIHTWGEEWKVKAYAAEARVAELERVREAAYNFDARFEERFINGQAKPLNDALAALAHKEETP